MTLVLLLAIFAAFSLYVRSNWPRHDPTDDAQYERRR